MSDDPSSPLTTPLSAATQPQATPERPWLGLAHFTAEDRDYFYGRATEIRELTDRVRRAPLTVLYGVSGYGKSSLIGAGLIPALRAAGHPIVLLRRCYDRLASHSLQAEVIAACAAAIPGCVLPDHTAPLTLWEFFHDRDRPWLKGPAAEEDDDTSAPWPVVLLDQFEEIFIKGEDRSSPDAAADASARQTARTFLTQLADLVENRPPSALRERLQSGRPEERRALVRQFDFQARPVRVAVAIRDDFLARLERWRRAMPSLMEHRVELRLLSGPQAFKAVFEPGRKRPGQPPILPEDVASAIVRAAAGAAPDVPLEEIDAVPPILSLLCERLNDRRLALNPVPASITAADFSPGEAKRILGRFYDDKLRPHPRALHEYLEDKLVSDSGYRESMSLDSALASLRAAIPDVEQRLRRLVDDRVLVIEDRGGIPRVELTHDTLARLGLERRAERQARTRRRKTIAWTVVSLAVAGVSLSLTAWALREKAQAEAATARALALVRFMEKEIGADRPDIPLDLRDDVSDRVETFYRDNGEPLALADLQRVMNRHMRKAAVRVAVARHYETEGFNPGALRGFILQEYESALTELNEASHLGEIAAKEVPEDRSVTRDQILTHVQFAAVLTQFKDISAQFYDAKGAAEHLQAARALLEGVVQHGPFPAALYMDWMGLPNLDAAMGDLAMANGDKTGAHAWYEKAAALQLELTSRNPADKERENELNRIQNQLRDTAP
jgi:hypothetical protein